MCRCSDRRLRRFFVSPDFEKEVTPERDFPSPSVEEKETFKHFGPTTRVREKHCQGVSLGASSTATEGSRIDYGENSRATERVQRAVTPPAPE